MPFFDFHIHPTLKCMFSEKDAKTSPWEDIETWRISKIVRLCSDFPYILNSQTNLRQLLDNGINLVCVTVFTPDPALTNADLILDQARGPLSIYLNRERLDKINSGELSPYPTLVHEDIFDVLLNPARFKVKDKKVVSLKNKNDYNENDNNTLYVVYSVEGCHTLSSTVNKNDITLNNVLENLKDLRSRLPIISLNLTHLEQYKFCNHAYGVLFVGSDDFNPTGERVSAEGVEIMKYCYENKILIDIKHTSLGARKMMIEDIRNRPEFTAINQPLVCTHAGFTGLSYADIPDFIRISDSEQGSGSRYILWGKPRKYIHQDAIAFNPSSINLYDEDIIAILESGGLIGLSLDKRILGFSGPESMPEQFNDLAFEEEYISKKEEGFFFNRPYGAKASDDHCITGQQVLDAGQSKVNRAFYHFKHFLAHVAHLVVVANKYNYNVNDALRQVCIGSDFDGLINPVWCCETIGSFQQMENKFVKYFPEFMEVNEVDLPQGFNIKKVARQLFFENGRDFVLDRVAKL